MGDGYNENMGGKTRNTTLKGNWCRTYLLQTPK